MTRIRSLVIQSSFSKGKRLSFDMGCIVSNFQSCESYNPENPGSDNKNFTSPKNTWIENNIGYLGTSLIYTFPTNYHYHLLKQPSHLQVLSDQMFSAHVLTLPRQKQVHPCFH